MANAPKVSPKKRAQQMLTILLVKDRDRLRKIDNYSRGHHASPYMPDNASAEYELLAERCSSNWPSLLISTPAQACYVDNFRPGRTVDDETTPEWKHWQLSRLDSRQSAIYRGALTFGHSFTLTEKVDGKVVTKGLSPLRTTALFRDAANDDTPLWALSIVRYATTEERGLARMWDGTTEYEVSFNNQDDVAVSNLRQHGASSNPVTRFVASVDLEGRTTGVIEPIIPLIDRINQTIFDLLVAQTYASIKVRTVSGMAPPMKMRVVTDDEGMTQLVPELDDNGRPIPEPINMGARLLYAKDPNTKFGTLDETPLGGFIESVDMSIRHLSAITQTPPHYLLGQIANLSADALKAAEISLSRKIQEFRTQFGESWERVFRLAAELSGVTESVEDYSGEVVWRDVDLSSISQTADGLGKLAESLGIPKRGLWKRVPNATDNEIREWGELLDEENADARIADALYRAAAAPVARPQASPTPSATAAPAVL